MASSLNVRCDFVSEFVQKEFVEHQAPCVSPREQLWSPEGFFGFLMSPLWPAFWMPENVFLRDLVSTRYQLCLVVT